MTALVMASLIMPRSAWAHDVWLLPSSFQVEIGELVRVDLRVGHAGFAETLGRNDQRLVRLDAIAPDGSVQALPGLQGARPAGVFRPDEAGLYRLIYQGNAARLELPAERFEAYLREHRFSAAIEQRQRSGTINQPGRELYSRSLKSLLRVGSGSDRGSDRGSDVPAVDAPLGLPLEFVVETPLMVARPAQTLPAQARPAQARQEGVDLRLLWQGEPLAQALVRASRLPAAAGAEEICATTDAAGRVRLPLTEGAWLVMAVHLQRAAEQESDVDWKSVWTAVTFELPAP